ncbi:MAG: Lrp/AsnC family transcriptional regulator [Chloroflexota bacterium]|nr:Lrp/AsnC family transcriptional regulator [Chloroflexota bacterium]
MAVLTAEERDVLAAIQDNLPLVREPYAAIASGLGLSEGRVMEIIASLVEQRKIKRIGAVPNHYALGITANGMSVWDIPDEIATEAGRRLGERDEVTHCYRRPRHPGWPYNIFGMVHGTSREDVMATVEAMGRELGIAQYPHDVLFSTRLLKKRGTRVRAADEQAGAS